MRHLRVLRGSSGPCLEILGGAALFLFMTCAAAAAGEAADGQAAEAQAAPVELPRAAWLGEFNFTSAAGADWASVESDIESRSPEASIPLKWRSGGFRADKTGDLLGGAFSFDKISWSDVPASAAEGFLVYAGRIAPGKGPGAVILKTTVAFDAPARRKLFFDADYFLAIYLNGTQVSRRYFSGAVRPDSSSIDVDFPQGPSEIAVVVGRRAGCGDFYLRIGTAHVTKRRIAVLSERERRFPNDRVRVLAAQREIAGLFTGALGDNAQGEIEFRRLCAMAGEDAPSKAHALERLAEIYKAAGRAGDALAALRSRMDLPECAGNDAGACRKAAIAFAAAAAAAGDLPAALDALATAAVRTGDDASLALSRARLLAAYSLAGRARLECDAVAAEEIEARPLDGFLHIAPAVDEVADQLHVPLRLHVAAHDAE